LLRVIICRCCTLQEAAAAGISLDTSTEDLGTLRTLWELQPFTNEAAVAQLMAAAQDLEPE